MSSTARDTKRKLVSKKPKEKGNATFLSSVINGMPFNLKKKKKNMYFVCVCVCHVSAWAQRRQKRASVMTFLAGAANSAVFSAGAVSTLNHRAHHSPLNFSEQSHLLELKGQCLPKTVTCPDCSHLHNLRLSKNLHSWNIGYRCIGKKTHLKCCGEILVWE